MPLRRRLLTLVIVAVLLSFFSVPIGFVAFGAAGASMGGLIVIGALMVLQFPIFMLLKKIGVLPSVDRKDDRP